MLENKIIIRSVYKFTRCFMEPARHPKTGRYAESVRQVNPDGSPRLSDEDRKTNRFFIKEDDVIEIYDGKEFNLDDEVDKTWWDAICYSRKIAQDRWEKDTAGNLVVDGNAKRYGTAEFYVEKPGLESRLRNSRKRAIHDAKQHIYNDTEKGLYQKARLLSNDMSGLPASDVEDYLVDVAEKTPQKITELYAGTDTHLRLLLLDAIEKHVIYNKDKLYYYGDNIILGATDSAVLHYFKNPANKRISDLIKSETYPEYAAAPKAQTIDTLTEEDLKPTPKNKK